MGVPDAQAGKAATLKEMNLEVLELLSYGIRWLN